MPHRILVLLMMVLLPLSVVAQTGDTTGKLTQIPPGQEATIDFFGVCRKVKNENPISVMVPHNSESEWSIGPRAFLASPRNGLGVRNCVAGPVYAWETHGWRFENRPSTGGSTLLATGGLSVQTRAAISQNTPSTVVNPAGSLDFLRFKHAVLPCASENQSRSATSNSSILNPNLSADVSSATIVCNQLATPTQINLPETIYAAPGGAAYSPTFQVTGLPSSRSEQLLIGYETSWVPADTNGGMDTGSSFRVGATTVTPQPTFFPYVPSDSPSLGSLNSPQNGWDGPYRAMGVPVVNDASVMFKLKASNRAEQTVKHVLQIGNMVEEFNVVTGKEWMRGMDGAVSCPLTNPTNPADFSAQHDCVMQLSTGGYLYYVYQGSGPGCCRSGSHLPLASFYDPETGACAPHASIINHRIVFGEANNRLYFGLYQICVNGRSTSPFLNRTGFLPYVQMGFPPAIP